jgi:hypothetical protein
VAEENGTGNVVIRIVVLSPTISIAVVTSGSHSFENQFY